MCALSSHPGWNRKAIADILMEAGHHAVSFFSGTAWELKDDGSLVTAVDVQNEAMLKERLTAFLPGSRFLGEETILTCGETYLQEAFTGDCWIVDPIDGTSSFAHGFPTWGVSIGLMHDGMLVDGGIALPALGEMLISDGANVIYERGIDFESKRFNGRCQKLPSLTETEFSYGGLFALGQNFTKHGDLPLPNPVVSTGSAVQALSYVLLGRAMAYIGHMKLWDIAGMLPMMARLGMVAWPLSGGEINCDVRNGVYELGAEDNHRWQLKEPMRAGAPKVLAALREKLDH